MLLLNKALPLIFLPFGLVCGLVIFALWKKKAWPGVVALALLYVCSIPLTARLLMGWLESRHPVIPVASAGPADAVVVLGGVLGPVTPPGQVPNWLETVERFEAGVLLVQAGRAHHLVFTGARLNLRDRETTEGAELRLLAIARGVPADRIVVTPYIDNTSTEARAVAGLMRERGWRRVIVVTSGWHMPRAALLFRQAGVDFIPFPVDQRAGAGARLNAGDFIPKADAWQVTETVLRECYGYAFYRLFR